MNKENPPVAFLLAVWGESYIRKFFDFNLRALLAPGNIPAMSQEYECTFIFLTLQKNIPFFQEQPGFDQLKTYCTIEFVEISDLIFDGNYSATLTLAYERGMRSRGEKMCQTYFFYFVSDYILADGSLHNLKRYLKAGVSAITSGNFLVVEEYVADKIKAIRDAHEGIIALSPRKMLSLILPYIHPVSLGQTVNQPYIHASHANRFFWKVHDTLILGRFYLRHMLCIKPELDNYVIGSSCDYSFIPEMCPSGKVAHIQDSDEYFVMEMAPFDYEKQFIHSGPFELKQTAEQLSQWTTSVHRENAFKPVIYHCENLHEEHHAAIQESENLIKEVEKHLSKTMQPTRDHFYWRACIESIFYSYLKSDDLSKRRNLYKNFLQNKTYSPLFTIPDDRFILKISHPPTNIPKTTKQIKKLWIKNKIAGSPLNTNILHLNWFDELQLKKSMQKSGLNNQPFIVLALMPIPSFVEWFEKSYAKHCLFQFYDLFMQRSSEELKQLFKGYRKILILLNQEQFFEVSIAIRKLNELLPCQSQILVYVKQQNLSKQLIQQNISITLSDLANACISCHEIAFPYCIARRRWEKRFHLYVNQAFSPGKNIWKRIFGYLGLGWLNLKCLIVNPINMLKQTSRKRSTCTIMRFSTNARSDNFN